MLKKLKKIFLRLRKKKILIFLHKFNNNVPIENQKIIFEELCSLEYIKLYVFNNKNQFKGFESNNCKIITNLNDLNNNFKKFDVIICSFYQDINYLIPYLKKNQIIVNLWHGMPIRKIGYEDRLEQNDENIKNLLSYNQHYKKKNKIYHIVFSDFYKKIFIDSFFSPSENIIKIDNFRINSTKLISSFKFNFKIFKKIIFFAPSSTPKNTNTLENFFKNFNIHEKPKFLNKFLKSNQYLLIIKQHPADKKIQINNFSNIISSDNYKNFTTTDILKFCDLFITDISSVFFDALFCKKKIFLLKSNYKRFNFNNLVLDQKYFQQLRIYKNTKFRDKLVQELLFRKKRKAYLDIYSKLIDRKKVSKSFKEALFDLF